MSEIIVQMMSTMPLDFSDSKKRVKVFESVIFSLFINDSHLVIIIKMMSLVASKIQLLRVLIFFPRLYCGAGNAQIPQ